MQRQGRHVLFVLDNCSVHNVQTSLTAFTPLLLPPNITSLYARFGQIHAFKASYRRCIVEHLFIAVDHPAVNLMLRVSLYSAIEMVETAWSEVTAACVRNCFRKASFINTVPDVEPDASEHDWSSGDLSQHIVDSDMGGYWLG
ncbi:tigger transposable element-derived protein 6-like [Dermacentor andersoni]|uniref:tigger transposable element-derived protein 6-like n=1 Tax=Dermacentor andersoni TaxID=34620 RepID=UPI003B3A0337